MLRFDGLDSDQRRAHASVLALGALFAGLETRDHLLAANLPVSLDVIVGANGVRGMFMAPRPAIGRFGVVGHVFGHTTSLACGGSMC